MASANMETDPFFTLLTDALRAGPGSPQWHDAVAALRQKGLDGADEHRLLIEARENLESGREYRSVRAGPGFTRKLMSDIESGKAGVRSNGIPTASIIAIVCGLLILAAIALIVYKVTPHDVTGPAEIEDLEVLSHRFFDTVTTASFNVPLKEGWHEIGSLPLSVSDGLRPNPQPEQENKGLGGGVAWTSPLSPTQAFAVDVSAHVIEPSSALLLEAFVSTDPNFSKDKGTSSRDLVWQLRGLDQQVVLSGSGQKLTSPPSFHDGDTIRLIVGPKVAIIEVVAPGGKTQRLWAGVHDLGANPRSVGVRFLQTGASGKQNLSVQQIKVSTTSAG